MLSDHQHVLFLQVDFASPTSQQEFFDALEATYEGDGSRKEGGKAHDGDRKERRRTEDGDHDLPIQARKHRRAGEEKEAVNRGLQESREAGDRVEMERSRRRQSKAGGEDWMNGTSKSVGKEQMASSSAGLLVTVKSFSVGSERSVSRMKEKEGRGRM